MSIFRIFALFFLTYSVLAHAGTTNCEPPTSGEEVEWTTMHKYIELNPANVNITVGSNLADWQVIYEMQYLNVGRFYATCTIRMDSQFTLLSAGDKVRVSGNDVIYKTDVPGIGMSIKDDNGYAVQLYPTVHSGWRTPDRGAGYYISVKYWKIPNENIPLANGPISVTGPDVGELMSSAGYLVTSSHVDRILNASGYDYYINSSRIMHGTLIFQVGTCNIEGDNVNVNMGDYDGKNNHSTWKDASFKLICPMASGYNGVANANYHINDVNYGYNLSPSAYISSNTKQNGPVLISIAPLNTSAVDVNKGIIALDGTGAQGYGIQLAWGDYASQNSEEPLNPVILNAFVSAHSLNTAFSDKAAPINGNAFTGGDNTIKMAARYIRTSGDAAPGPANAVVQVIANYQ
ncbi:TPA: fimbrial protein [Citrobacter amalonaticus]|jgi:type 1 fimbria pilin|nr:hypothetical protein [Citrobacter amalonaticus]